MSMLKKPLLENFDSNAKPEDLRLLVDDKDSDTTSTGGSTIVSEKGPDAWEAAMCARLAALDGYDARSRSPDPVWNDKKLTGRDGLSHPGEVLAARAAARPNAMAVEYWPEYGSSQYEWHATYFDFLKAVQVFTRAINRSAVPLSCNNSIAVMYMDRGPESVVSMWGCFYAGIAVTCVDYSYPLERLKFTLDDTAAKVLLVKTGQEVHSWVNNDDAAPIIPEGVRILGVRDVLDAPQNGYVPPLPPCARSDSELCAIIYTSGSTGKPKGVELLLGGFSNYCCIEQHLIDMQYSDRTLQTQSLSFVSGFMETFRPLIAGATLVVAGNDIAQSGEDLFPWVDMAGITFFKCVPSLLRAVLGVEERPPVPAKLRVLLASGEALEEDLIRRVYAGAEAHRTLDDPSLVILNTYGPTELNANCTVAVMKPGEERTSIGHPYPTYAVYCLDDKNQVAAKGELCVGGMSLAKGYLGRKDATDAAFFEHPKLGRLYRTGDLATKEPFSPEGKFYYAGRIAGSAQVKVNGYRVELGEVEGRVRKLPQVAEAVVLFINGQLVAVAKQRPGTTLKLPEAREALFQAGLPKHAQPSRLVLVDEVPKTISGKLDRNAAKAIVEAETSKKADAVKDHEPPKCDIERVVREKMAEVLGRKTGPKSWSAVSAEDDFFGIGGSSVTAGRLVSALRRAGPEFSSISVRTLYNTSVAADLVKLVKSTNKSKNAVAAEVADRAALKISMSEEIQGKPYPRIFALCQLVYIFVLLCLKAAKIGALWCVCSVGQPTDIVTAYFDIPVWAKCIVGALFLATNGVIMHIIMQILSLVYLLVLKRLVIGKYEEGRYALYGKKHLMHWMVEQTSRMLGPGLGPWALWMLGARINEDAKIIATNFGAWDLLDIGPNASLSNCYLTPVSYERDAVVFAKVEIGEDVVIRPSCTVVGPAKVNKGAVLDCMSSLYGGIIPAHEMWKGSPAQKEDAVPTQKLSAESKPLPGYELYLALFKFVTLFTAAVLSMIPSVSVFILVPELRGLQRWVVIFPISAVVAVPVVTMVSAAACRLAKGGVLRKGRFDWKSREALIAEYTAWVFHLPQETLNNTSLLCHFFRMAGCRLGQGANMAQLKGALPALVDIGPDCTFANWVTCGFALWERGTIDLREFHVEHDTLLGNRSLIPPGTQIPAESIGGVLSVPPQQYVKPHDVPELDHGLNEDRVMFMGNPPIRLREVVHGSRPQPTRWQHFRREVADWVVVFFPCMLVVLPKIAWLFLFWWLEQNFDIGLASESIITNGWQIMSLTSLSTFTLLVLTYVAAHAIVPVFLAWLAVLTRGGYVRPGQHDFWSFYVDRWHLGNKIMNVCVNKDLVTPLANSRWLNIMLRVISKSKVHFTALLTGEGIFRELDLVQIGANAVVNEGVVFRTHTFENWTLQFNPIKLEQDVVVGCGSELMSGSVLREGCDVKHLTFVNKGEEVPKYTQYAGLPGEVLAEV